PARPFTGQTDAGRVQGVAQRLPGRPFGVVEADADTVADHTDALELAVLGAERRHRVERPGEHLGRGVGCQHGAPRRPAHEGQRVLRGDPHLNEVVAEVGLETVVDLLLRGAPGVDRPAAADRRRDRQGDRDRDRRPVCSLHPSPPAARPPYGRGSTRWALASRLAVGFGHVRTLVIGSGGREHALVLALSRDPGVSEVHAAPGNPGMVGLATLHDVTATDPVAVADLAERIGAGLVVVGPEAPLVAGVADAVSARGIACFGPSADAARLEGSKAFAKEVMAAAAVPTAEARVCGTEEEVAAALDAFGAPYVVKDDGLAAGKGVVVTDDRDAALAHGLACGQVVVEDYLDGPEVSLFAITDGSTVYPLQPAQDFTRIFDGDPGRNAGGMGAYTPLPWSAGGPVSHGPERVHQRPGDELARRGTPVSVL